MAFFTAFTDAIASRQSLFVAGLDPNPEMLCHWASSRNLSGRSLLSQARAWCKEVIEATADHVCAYSRASVSNRPWVRGIGAVDGSAGAAATGSPFDH